MTPDPVLREAAAKALLPMAGCYGYYERADAVLAALDGLVVPVEEHEAAKQIIADVIALWEAALDASLTREREAAAEIEGVVARNRQVLMALRLACDDGWEDGDAAIDHYLVKAWLALDSSEAPERDPACVERWSACDFGLYDPRCCRFPKSCSPIPPYPQEADRD
jgi:hypothetical protein